MNGRTKAYFNDLPERAVTAHAVPRAPWPEARPNACHANCEAFVLRFGGYELVRGWLVFEGYWFVPHSVVREKASGRFVDITPDPSNSGTIPFVDHRGTEEDFALLRKGRDGGWPYPEPTGIRDFGCDPAEYASSRMISEQIACTNHTEGNNLKNIPYESDCYLQ